MDMILKNTFQSISPAYELIGDVTVGTNTTQVDFTGLNIGKDDELLLVSNLLRSATGLARISIYFNGYNSNSNYYKQTLECGGTVVSANRENNSTLMYIGNSEAGFFITPIKLTTSGHICSLASGSTLTPTPSQIALDMNYNTSTFTASSVSNVMVYSSLANAIGTGSRFQLYKLVAEKVADIIVPTNTTSVDITGLNIGKDGAYYLTGTVLGVSTSMDSLRLFANANYTNTNYWRQRVYGLGTSVGGSRDNFPVFCERHTNSGGFISAKLKLTNSGYLCFQSDTTTKVGTSGIELLKHYGTATFTTNSVTALRIQSEFSNNIGANSRFTLYKMK